MNHSASHNIQAAFFDIDGTLTSFTTHEIPRSTIDAIHQLQEQGIRVLICTGRSPAHARVVLEHMPVQFDGIVALNGQYCFDNNGFLEEQPITTADVRIILDWLDQHPHVVANYSEYDRTYFNQVSQQMLDMYHSLGKTAPQIVLDDPRSRYLEHPIYQISPYIDRAAQEELTALCSNVRGVRWHPDFVDLIPGDGGKHRGIERFIQHYGIEREQTIAFGDGGNDIDMLTYAGIGVAMGNATQETQAAADIITDDVDDDGILHALQRLEIVLP